MAAQAFSFQSQNTHTERNSKYFNVMLVRYGDTGINGYEAGATPTVNQSGVLLCTVKSLSEIGISREGEAEIMLPGKKSRKTYDSQKFEATLTLQGNAMGTFLYMFGLSSHQFEAINWLKYQDALIGALVIESYDEKFQLISSTLIPDIRINIDNISGMAETGFNDQAFKLYNLNASISTLYKGAKWCWSLFRDNGASITNAAAPDGTLTAFILDDCNNSGTSTPPQPFQYDRAASGWQRYFPVLRVDSTTPSTAEVSFATATLTFTTAPADGASILAIYGLDTTTYDWPYRGSTVGKELYLSESAGNAIL